MISPRQAWLEIAKRSKPWSECLLPLDEAWGLTLSALVRAPFAYPLFDNAALDGYAVRARDTEAAAQASPVRLRLAGSQFAGEFRKARLKPGQALHVTTGAPLPKGANALVPYEAVHLAAGEIVVHRPVPAGWNIRRRGEDGRKGAVLARAGDRLHARRLAMLASFGVARVRVRPTPRVAVAVSGDELLQAGRQPEPGKIFDGNGPALRALLKEAGAGLCAEARLPDNAKTQSRRLGVLLGSCDVLLVAGGMSVGARDLAKSVLESLGVRRIFWRVAQKPGKPLYFGARGRTLVFGLPGNPAALVACFVAYVLPCLRLMSGEAPAARGRVVLAHGLRRNGPKALFLKAQVLGQGPGATVKVLRGQGSHLLRSLADGNALVLRRAHAPALKKGGRVEVLPL